MDGYDKLLELLLALRSRYGLPDREISEALDRTEQYRRYAPHGWAGETLPAFCRAMRIPRRPGPARLGEEARARCDEILRCAAELPGAHRPRKSNSEPGSSELGDGQAMECEEDRHG